MDSNTNKKCMVCGSTDISTFLDCTDHFITKETFRIDTCRSCGFRFTANAPAVEQIGAYYKSEAYISHSDTHKGLINKLYHIVRNIMIHLTPFSGSLLTQLIIIVDGSNASITIFTV